MKKYNRIVVKIGTRVMTSGDGSLDKDFVKDIVRQISDIMDKGTSVLLVTSGAIGAGLWLLNMKRRPKGRIEELQAAAAIGQSHLMNLYGEYFKQRGYLTGQILLTQEDFNDRKRYLNIKRTIDALLKHKAVPVINENDTVATDEIKCGDNDRLSGLVSDLCQAEKLIMLTDVDGLIGEDGKVIDSVRDITPKILRLAAGSSCDLGTGGMATKIQCARNVIQSGIECVIANGRQKDILLKIMQGENAGTVFDGRQARFIAKKRWIAFSSRSKGKIIVDDGAREALRKKDRSLLASGVLAVEGAFNSGDVASIVDTHGKEIGRGLVNYSSSEISRIKGFKTEKFKDILGYKGRDAVVHKDNLVIL